MDEKKIKDLINNADKEVENQKYENGLKFYRLAVELIPEPFIENELSTEILAAIGDTYFIMGDYKKAKKAFSDVMLCPGAPESDYIRLRRGQIAFELQDLKKAKKELACAYMNGGEEVFQDEDQKYFNFVKSFLKT